MGGRYGFRDISGSINFRYNRNGSCSVLALSRRFPLKKTIFFSFILRLHWNQKYKRKICYALVIRLIALKMESLVSFGALIASGSNDGPNGFSCAQAVAKTMIVVRRKPGLKVDPISPELCAFITSCILLCFSTLSSARSIVLFPIRTKSLIEIIQDSL